MVAVVLRNFGGYRIADIKTLTPAQLSLLFKEAMRSERDAMVRLAGATRTAFHADNRQYQRFLEDVGDREESRGDDFRNSGLKLVPKQILKPKETKT